MSKSPRAAKEARVKVPSRAASRPGRMAAVADGKKHKKSRPQEDL
jgi:hypothetical protein